MAETKTVKKAEKKPAKRYFIGNGIEITEEQAKAHVEEQNKRAKK